MHTPIVCCAIAVALLVGCPTPALANEAGPPDGWQDTVETVVLPEIATILSEAIVGYTVSAQNARLGNLAQAEIDDFDAQWRAERGQPEQPLISAVLSNPTSTYLTRVQAQSLGLFTEIFIMDDNGLNVGQSNITSDFWQGDEAKFQRTYGVGAGTVFVDEPEFRDDIGVWVVQVNTTVDGEGAAIGAATFEVNLTELTRRHAAAQIGG